MSLTLSLKIMLETVVWSYYKKENVLVLLSQAVGLVEGIFIEFKGFYFSFLLHLRLFQNVILVRNRKIE